VTSCGSPSVPEGLKTMRLSRIFSTCAVEGLPTEEGVPFLAV